MEKRRRKKTALEFSKQIFKGVSALVVAIVVFTMYMVLITRDLSPLMYLIPSSFAELAAATGFYYNKAKAENRIKMMLEHGIAPSEEAFRE